MLSIDFLWNS